MPSVLNGCYSLEEIPPPPKLFLQYVHLQFFIPVRCQRNGLLSGQECVGVAGENGWGTQRKGAW